jgi:pimeloyl-ACP methyl ester carboxylesterase
MMRALLLSLLLGGCAHWPVQKPVCGKLAEKSPWSYCLLEPDAPTGDVLYYLHGGGGSERSWFKPDGYAEGIEKGLAQKPAIATLSLGPYWLLTPERAAALTAEALPALEAKLKVPAKRRFLVGESMGGFNSSRLLLERGDLFERVALLCPGLSDLAPQADAAELSAYVERTHARKGQVEWAQSLARKQFPSREAWDAVSPLGRVEKVPIKGRPRVYVSCGRKDEFGFFTGAERFARALKAKGVETVWEPVDGGHCSVAPASVARFLSAP